MRHFKGIVRVLLWKVFIQDYCWIKLISIFQNLQFNSLLTKMDDTLFENIGIY